MENHVHKNKTHTMGIWAFWTISGFKDQSFELFGPEYTLLNFRISYKKELYRGLPFLDTPLPPAGRRIFGATAPRTAPTYCYIGIHSYIYIYTHTYRVCYSGYIGLSSYCIGIKCGTSSHGKSQFRFQGLANHTPPNCRLSIQNRLLAACSSYCEIMPYRC